MQSRTLRKYEQPVAAHVLGYIGEVNQKEIDNNPYYNMWESPSWHNEESMNWCEYLMWEQGINTNMPMKLEYKYYKNEENDKEVKKRRKYFFKYKRQEYVVNKLVEEYNNIYADFKTSKSEGTE